MELAKLWQNIREEADDLARAMERLPDHCESGSGEAHLSGRCSCCKGHRLPSHSANGADCLKMIDRLRADLTILNQDLSVAAPALDVVASETRRMELRRSVFLASGNLQTINEAFKRLTGSVIGFRRECTISRMRTIKRHCFELRDHCVRVNRELLGSGEQ